MEKRILIIDNDRASVEPLKAELEREGYLVSLVEEGETELSQIAKLRPDAIIFEVALPDQDGFELITAVRVNPTLREMLVFVHTVCENIEYEVSLSYWKAGVDAYMPNGSATEIACWMNRAFEAQNEPADYMHRIT